jgi:hypothetical protein
VFGTLRCNYRELTSKGRTLYSAHYCGLCAALRAHYGLRSTILLNWDATFLSLLFNSQTTVQPRTGRVRCPVSPLAKRDAILPEEPCVRFGADVTLLVLGLKVYDDLADRQIVRSKVLGTVFGRQIARARARCEQNGFPFPDFDVLGREQIELEETHSSTRSLESYSEPSARISALVFSQAAHAPAKANQRGHLRNLGYAVGKLVYVYDSIVDLAHDVAHSKFNPLAACYGIEGYDRDIKKPRLGAGAWDSARRFVEKYVARASAAFAFLQGSAATNPVIENAIFEGLAVQSLSLTTPGMHRLQKAGMTAGKFLGQQEDCECECCASCWNECCSPCCTPCCTWCCSAQAWTECLCPLLSIAGAGGCGVAGVYGYKSIDKKYKDACRECCSQGCRGQCKPLSNLRKEVDKLRQKRVPRDWLSDIVAGPDVPWRTAGREYAGMTCAYNSFAIRPGEAIVLCPADGIPHHAECWQENGGCTRPGCPFSAS